MVIALRVSREGTVNTASVSTRQKTGRIPVTEDVRSLPVGAKRPRGWPKKLPGCLVRSPVRAPLAAAPESLDVSTESLEVTDRTRMHPVEAVRLEICTSCTEDGQMMVAEVYCQECTEYMSEEHKRAHSKTLVTKNHTITSVRDLHLEEEKLQLVLLQEEVVLQEEVLQEVVLQKVHQQEVPQTNKVTCPLCQALVAKKSLRAQERTQKCKAARPAPSPGQ